MAEEPFILPQDKLNALRPQVPEVDQELDLVRAEVIAPDSPDDAAYDQRKAVEEGLPAGVIAFDRDYFRQKDEANELRQITEQSPRVGDWMRRAENYAVAKDSAKELSLLEQGLTQTGDFGRSFGAGSVSLFGSGLRGIGELLAAGGAIGEDVVRLVPGGDRLLELEDELISDQVDSYINPARNFYGLGQNISEVGDIVRPDEQGFEDQVAEGLGQIASAVVLGLTPGGQASTFSMFAGMGADQQGQRMRENDLDPAQNPKELALGAAVTAGSEALRLGSILRVLPPAMRKRTLNTAIGRIFGQAGEEAAQEAFEGVAQNLIAMGYDEEAKLLEGIGEQATTAGAAAAIFQSLIEVALPGRSRAVSAEQAAERMTGLREAVESAPVLQRSRQHVEDFIRQASEGETVLLDAEGVTTLYQSDPAAFNQLLEPLGLTESQVEAAFDGSDVEIEAAKLLTVEQGFDDLVRIARTSPEAMTLAEVEALAQEDAADVDMMEAFDRFNQENEALEGFERVERAVESQLRDAGRGEREAKAAGAVWGAVFRRFEEDGVDAGVVFDRLGLRINEQAPNDATDAEVLGQATKEGFEGIDGGEAREWLAAKAKGLPMDRESVRARAREQGFDTAVPVFHRTKATLEGDALRPGEGGTMGPGIYVSQQRPFETSRDAIGEVSDQEQILKMYLRKGRAIEREPDLQDRSPLARYDLMSRSEYEAIVNKHAERLSKRRFNKLTEDQIYPLAYERAQKELARKGFVGAWNDLAESGPRHGASQDIVIFDPSNIRSIHAAFDPDNAGSANLLAQSKVPGVDILTPEARAKWFAEHVQSEVIPGEAINSAMYGFKLREDLPIVVYVAPEAGSGATTVEWTFMDREETGAAPFERGGEQVTLHELAALKHRILAIMEHDIETHKRDAYVYTSQTPAHGRMYRRALRDAFDDYDLLEIDDEAYLIYSGADIDAIRRIIPSGREVGNDDGQGAANTLEEAEARAQAFRDRVRAGPDGGIASAARQSRNLDQGGSTPRAQVRIPGDGVLSDQNVFVNLTEAADKTSFLHESAHIFLELYASLESENTAVAERMGHIRQWLKAKPDEKLTRAQHEKFAESFEAYLMEGVAPTREMRGVFHTFRAWFTEVYRRLRNALPNLTPEARDIFDRMLATDADIELARAEYAGTLSSTMRGLMTPEQVEKYQHHARKAGEVAKDKLFKKHMAEVKRRENKAYKAERAETEARIREELEATQGYKARAELGDRAIDSPEAEVVAAENGYTSAASMVSELSVLAPLDKAVRLSTDAAMKAKYGDLLTDGTIEAEALEAVFNEPSIRVLEAERNMLAQKASKDTIPLAAIRKRADQVINTTPIDEVIKPGRYAIAARNLHKKSINAAAKGKWDDALRFTHQAMFQHEMARRAFKARDEIKKGNRFLARFAPHRKLDPKKINPEHIAQIRALMALPGEQAQAEGRAMLNAFAAEQAELGYPVVLPSDVVLGNNLKLRRRMTMEQFREFRDGVRNLNKLGREQSEEVKVRKNAEMEALAASIQEKAGTKHAKGRFEDRTKTWGGSFNASLRKLPFLARVLDGGPDSFGPFYKAVVLPLREAGGVELELKAENQKRVNEIIDRHKLQLGKKVYVRQFKEELSLEQLWALALNTGNEGNLSRLLNDPNFAMNEATLQAVLNEHLPQNYWDAAQEVWDFIDSRWPQIAELEKRTTGIAPTKVEPKPVVTQYGAYRGGYYPLKYDPHFHVGGAPASESATEFEAQTVRGGVMGRTQTRHGHTIERQQGVKRSVWLSLNVLTQHLDEVAHDLAYREAFNQAATVLHDGRIEEAISDAVGQANLEAMQTIVERVATGQIKPRGPIERMMRTLRVNAASADLGLNIRSILTQPLGLTQTFAKLGTKAAARGYVEYLSDIPAATEFAYEKSDFLRNRSRVITRDMRDALSGERSRGALNRIRAYAMVPMQQVDAFGVAIPTWIAAYNKKLEDGASEADAIGYADSIVADTQASGLTMDLTTLQSGTEFEKLFTYMYGYFSTTLNLTYEAGQLAEKYPARAVAMLIMLYTIPGVIAEAVLTGIAGEDDEDMETRLMKTALLGHMNQATATLPMAREAVSAFRYGRGQETFYGRVLSGLTRSITGATRAIGERDAEAGHRAAVNSIRTAGLVLGIPGAGTLARLYDTIAQDDDPTLTEVFLTGPDDDN